MSLLGDLETDPQVDDCLQHNEQISNCEWAVKFPELRKELK